MGRNASGMRFGVVPHGFLADQSIQMSGYKSLETTLGPGPSRRADAGPGRSGSVVLRFFGEANYTPGLRKGGGAENGCLGLILGPFGGMMADDWCACQFLGIVYHLLIENVNWHFYTCNKCIFF